MKWICFKNEYPKPNTGLIMKITIPGTAEDNIYYGFVWPNGYIYIILRIINANEMIEMAWKVLKDYDLSDIYWFHNLQLSVDFQPERLSPETR
jgi:hypothetical protein